MGISRGAIKLIASTLGSSGPRQRAITFGVQRVETDDGGNIHQDELFGRLGFGRVESIDYYPNESPTYVIDLNLPAPTELRGQFDLVYDGGTMEHCFNVPQVLLNAASLVAVGGLVIHHVPMNNWVDHGFYQFSPTLFFDFYGAAGFEELQMKIHFIARRGESYMSYDPRTDLPVPYVAGGGKKLLIFFSARKSATAQPERAGFPIQGRYRASFGSERSANAAGNRKTFLGRMRASLRKRFFGWGARAL
jgi:SAM-dependent methyltransferase